MLLRLDERHTGFTLGIERVEILLQAPFARLSRVDGAAGPFNGSPLRLFASAIPSSAILGLKG
jgi:hypothetical protein